MKTIEKCIFVVSIPSPTLLALLGRTKEDVEQCKHCTYDFINNPRCKNYIPVNVYVFEERYG